jgi:hypothetical protein
MIGLTGPFIFQFKYKPKGVIMEPEEVGQIDPTNAALEILDSGYEYRERRCRDLMTDARETADRLNRIMIEMSRLNRENIEINKARVELRKLLNRG